jgi:hypothetical protein
MRWNFSTWATRKVLMVSSFYNGARLNKYCGLVQIVASYMQARQPSVLHVMEQILKEFPQNLFHHVQSTWEKRDAPHAMVSCCSHAKNWNQTFVRYIQTILFCNEPIWLAHHSTKLKLWRLPRIKGYILKYRVPPLWPTYIGERRTTFAKAYGIKVSCYVPLHKAHIQMAFCLRTLKWESRNSQTWDSRDFGSP